MSTIAQIYLIRHGETAWSLTGQHTGCTDLALTENGESQARDLAPALRELAFARVLTSPSLRARQTCELAGLSRQAKVDPLLAEWDYGQYEGLRTATVRESHPNWSIWLDGCPGGECPGDVARRAHRLMARLCPPSDGDTGPVALFTHGQFARVLAARWIGVAAAEGRHLALDTATVSILGTETGPPSRPVIALWNAKPCQQRWASPETAVPCTASEHHPS